MHEYKANAVSFAKDDHAVRVFLLSIMKKS